MTVHIKWGHKDINDRILPLLQTVQGKTPDKKDAKAVLDDMLGRGVARPLNRRPV